MGKERKRMLGLPISLDLHISPCNLNHKGSFGQEERMHRPANLYGFLCKIGPCYVDHLTKIQ